MYVLLNQTKTKLGYVFTLIDQNINANEQRIE